MNEIVLLIEHIYKIIVSHLQATYVLGSTGLGWSTPPPSNPGYAHVLYGRVMVNILNMHSTHIERSKNRTQYAQYTHREKQKQKV